MSDIYTSIDLGTDSIKIVVCEKINDNYHVLACTSSPSSGINNGFVSDMKLAVTSVKNALKKVNYLLGINIKKVVACVPSENCKMDIITGSSNVTDYNEITGVDISNVLQDALKDQDFGDRELVTLMPISFTVDDKDNVKSPLGLKGSVLSTRAVVSTMDKEALYRILEVIKLSGLETVDICYNSFGDYYSLCDKNCDNLVGAIINIGVNSTNISIFNRGIQIKNGVIPIGSRHVDKDLSYVFRTSEDDSRNIKENFAVAMASYADSSDTLKVDINNGESKEINQLGVSKVVEARIRELLKLAKNEIKNLTNRQIRYIIITGGLSELAGFQYLVEQEYGFVANVGNIGVMGIRHNKYSSCYGIIKYFNDKLSLRQKHYNMFSVDEIDKIHSINNKFENK